MRVISVVYRHAAEVNCLWQTNGPLHSSLAKENARLFIHYSEDVKLLDVGDAVLFNGTQRFTIVQELGEGGMGTVYEARDTERDMVVALKTLKKFDPKSLNLFKNEFRALTNVAHENLISLYELYSENEQWFFTMELVHGVDFLHAVRVKQVDEKGNTISNTGIFDDCTLATQALSFKTGPADIPYLRECLKQLCEGVYALHNSGHLHCDLKPSNVMVTPEGRVVIRNGMRKAIL